MTFMANRTLTIANEMVEFSLLEVVHRVIRGRYILLAIALVGLAVGVTASYLWKPWYTSQAVFLPPRYGDVSTPAAAILGTQDASDVYFGLLYSRTVQDDVVDHLDLKRVYHTPSQTIARALLQSYSNFGVGRNSLLYITIKASEPKLAADIANAYMDALYRLNGQMVSSASDRRRIFFEEQLNQQKQQLEQAELALKQAEEKTGVLLPANEAEAGLNATASLQAQIDAAETRLSGLLVSETDQNPEVVEARTQLASLRSELARQLAGSVTGRAGIASAVSMPGVTLEIEKKQRDVHISEDSYSGLLQQYARARLATIDPGPQLEVVDYAVPAEFKAGPNRKTLVEEGFGIGLLVGLLYLIFFEPLRRLVIYLRPPAISR